MPNKPALKKLYELTKDKNRKHLSDKYNVAGDYGDLDFTNLTCDFNPDNPDKNIAPLHDLLAYLKKHIIAYKALFPKARLVIVLPSLYKPGTHEQGYLTTVKHELDAIHAELIVQSIFNDPSLMCDKTAHPNYSGRIVRTKELAKLLKKSTDQR